MFGIFQNFEQVTARFSTSVLMGSGVAILLLGLLIWLGGLGLRKILISLAGLVSGIVVGLFVVGRNLFSASLSAALAGLIALIFEKVLVVLLAAALAAAVAFAVLAEPYFEQAETMMTHNETAAQTSITSLDETLQELKTFGLDAGEKIKQAGTKIPVYIWAMIAAPAVIILICGVVLWRFTSALFFSVLGAMFVFLGMILLLSSKRTEPVSHISGKPLIYAAVFLAMTAFGTIEQLLLCKGSKKKKVTEIEADREKGKSRRKGKEEPEKIVQHDWRSA
jgi:predicted membrane protein